MIVIECFVLLAIVLVAIFASFLPLPGPNSGDLLNSLSPPGTPHHVLGTDLQGRDILSRIVYGARTSLAISCGSAAAALVIGVALGVIAGYIRPLDMLIMRVVDVELAFPSMILAIAVVAGLGKASAINVLIVLIITGWIVYARTIRSSVLSLRETLFVEAALAMGVGPARIMLRHIVPGVLPTALALASVQIPMFMITEASLSYLGLGVPASTPTWGVMLEEGQQTIFSAWWPVVFPALAMAVAVLLITSLADFAVAQLEGRH